MRPHCLWFPAGIWELLLASASRARPLWTPWMGARARRRCAWRCRPRPRRRSAVSKATGVPPPALRMQPAPLLDCLVPLADLFNSKPEPVLSYCECAALVLVLHRPGVVESTSYCAPVLAAANMPDDVVLRSCRASARSTDGLQRGEGSFDGKEVGSPSEMVTPYPSPIAVARGSLLTVLGTCALRRERSSGWLRATASWHRATASRTRS